MPTSVLGLVVVPALALLAKVAPAAGSLQVIPLDSKTPMELRNGRVLELEHAGRRAIQLAPRGETSLRGAISRRDALGALAGGFLLFPTLARAGAQERLVVAPDSARFLTVRNGRTELVEYRGRRALRTIPAPETAGKDEDVLAILDCAPLQDGVLEIDVAGAPRPDAPADSRGFVGLAFRTGERGEWSELFYLRPTNARCDDQLRRNHSVQYASHPDFPWHRLREEAPGKYESYADMEAGAWTPLKIVVAGATARLYVNGAEQPTLVVTDLKHGAAPGHIALWAHVETDAYFGTLTVSPR